MYNSNNKIFILVSMNEDCVSDAEPFSQFSSAEEAFKEWTGVPYSEYKRRLVNEDCDEILGDYAGTEIFEKVLKYS